MSQNQEKISWDQLSTRIPQGIGTVDVCGLSGSAANFAMAGLLLRQRRPVIIVADTDKAAHRIREELSLFSAGWERKIDLFPAYNLTAYKPMAFHNETAAGRISILHHITESTHASIIITTIAALSQKLLPKKELIQYGELLQVGEAVDRDVIVRKLIAGGYSRTMIVEEHGDFCLRGGILDVHSPLYDDPLRIEFFGDEVESIRCFAAETQRTIEEMDEAVLLPAREAILDRTKLTAIVGRLRTRAAELGLPVTRVRELVHQIKTQEIYPGIESLMPLIYADLDAFFDYMPSDALFMLVEPIHLAAAATELVSTAEQSYHTACGRKQLCVPPDQLYLTWDQICERLSGFSQVMWKTMATAAPPEFDSTGSVEYSFSSDDHHGLRQAIQSGQKSDQPFQPLVDWFNERMRDDYTTFVVCRHVRNMDRLSHILSNYGLRPVQLEQFSQAVYGQRRIYLICGVVRRGFSWPSEQVSVLTDEDIFGTRYHRRRKIRRPKPADLINFDDLRQGDWVVHAEHGIGQYGGLTKLQLNGAVNDFLLVHYRDEDKLYLPVERMDQLQKYMGVEGVAPVMDKMGGKSWDRIKRKVKRKAEKIAGELLKLYAARKVQQGHAFGEVDTHFQNFEEGFPFEETPDQLKAIDDVFEDMRRKVPMDRLVCGDVGYGKTEVALRAAFLTISEAKQVAMLVPTTVLAEQHFETFRQRFARYPVKVACLSRFRPASEQRRIVEEIESGQVDIAVGTHRLLQKDIVFNDLGLLVLDEEQRFGVRHKEKIKRIRKTVDVLTLTATPIPRTLHLSLLGVRDISIINTPPEQRRPIVTYVTEFEEVIVAEAIRKELKRSG
ncbi:MAG: CarD family transcriptional regulator, partial [Desulfobacteraceae bacterium]